MPIAWLTRKVAFSAAHRYWRPNWPETRNRAVFGPCANPHGHGHNYRLEVTVAAEIDPETGFSADLARLDELLNTHVVEALDHQHLNYVVPEFAEGGLIPTTENILAWLWPRLADGLPEGQTLRRLVLHENDTFFVEYFGGREP